MILTLKVSRNSSKSAVTPSSRERKEKESFPYLVGVLGKSIPSIASASSLLFSKSLFGICSLIYCENNIGKLLGTSKYLSITCTIQSLPSPLPRKGLKFSFLYGTHKKIRLWRTTQWLWKMGRESAKVSKAMARNVGQLMFSSCVPFQHQQSPTQLISNQTPPTSGVGQQAVTQKFVTNTMDLTLGCGTGRSWEKKAGSQFKWWLVSFFIKSPASLRRQIIS